VSDPSPIDGVIARDEIRQLVARYAVAMDARDLDAVVALFVDDVRLGRGRQGRAALRDDLAHALRDMPLTILNVGTQVIEMDDTDHARGIVYCRGELQLGDTWVVQMIQYRDIYECRDGAWLFARRQHLLWYGREVGTSPLGLPPAHWPEHDTGWGEPETWTPWGPPGQP
jgi:ketosteroid isomerase-like protein